MASEPDKIKPRRRPSDLYGSLATVAESGLLISPTSEWDLKQRRIWPPAPCQAYCEKHFIQECLVYYTLEMEKIEEEGKKKEMKKDNAPEAETLPAATTATLGAAQKQPTRVQPGRRAKGTSAASASRNETSSASRRRKFHELSVDEYEKMERRQELCLNLSWAEYHDKLRALIKRTGKKLSRKKRSPHVIKKKNKKKGGSPPEASAEGEFPDNADHCPLQGLIKVECRYCEHRPEINGDGCDDSDAAGNAIRWPPPNRGHRSPRCIYSRPPTSARTRHARLAA
ncbi:hypothetical protein PG993_004648 [Apiospora rasikravindrae]|uniref:Uncharacterized protein n=1 Tax=Apiospora rasikravindrae TaxID=990691 RepID=A0ABR1TDF3_9PEZI